MKTNEEHAANNGLNCPVCGSGRIQFSGPYIVDGDTTRQLADCQNCPAEWADEYKLVGFELENPEEVNAWEARNKPLPADIVARMQVARVNGDDRLAKQLVDHLMAGGDPPEMSQNQQNSALLAWCRAIISENR